MASDNDKLVEYLVSHGFLRTKLYIDAFRKVDRGLFVPEDFRPYAYVDEALPLGPGQTISQPSTVALMIEWLSPQVGDKVLDVGAGSGWQTALLAEIVGPSGQVVGIEVDPELVEQAQKRLAGLRLKQATVKVGDGSRGMPDQAPWSRMIFAVTLPTLPEELPNQLSVGGTLVVPVGTDRQEIRVISRRSVDKYDTQVHPGFAFVPLKHPK